MISNSVMGKKFISRKYKALLFSFFDCLFSKNAKKIIIVVKERTVYSGNIRVATDVLLKNKKYKIYIYKDGLLIPEIKMNLKNNGVEILEGWNVSSLYHLFTSGVFIFSHSPRDAHITKKCKNRKIINLWHGVAFKKIENLMPSISKKKKTQMEQNSELFDLLIASSDTDLITNMKAFMVQKEKIKVIGLPRYDILKKSYKLDTFLMLQKTKLLMIKGSKKFIVYAPTFREKSISPLAQLNKEDWDVLSTFLEQKSLVMGIRPHSYDISVPSYIENSKNFFWLGHESFTETNLILQISDMLIVDFSSIWIDYLLLNKPILGFAKDFNFYKQYERGFIYEFDSIFPTKFTNTVDDLLLELEEVLYTSGKAEYTKTLNLFHEYKIEVNFSKKLEETLNNILN